MPSQGLRNARLFPIRQLFSAFLPPSGDAVDVGVVRKRPSGLLYDVDETPPLLVRLGVSFQHVFLLSVVWLYVLVIVNSIGGTEAEAQAIPQSQLDNDTQAKLAAKAAVESGQAAVEQAQLNLGYTKVRSLIDGIAGIAQVQVGNLVTPTTVLTGVSQISPIKAYFPISGVEYLRIAGRVSPGTVNLLSRNNPIPLELVMPTGNPYPYKGKILFANRQMDSQTGTIQIVGAFPNPGDILRPGQTVRIRSVTELRKGALLVPQRAVTELQGSYQVAVLQPSNKIAVRTVQVGEQVGSMWIIDQGLKPGEQVVAEGTQAVRDGLVVTPKPYVVPTEAN